MVLCVTSSSSTHAHEEEEAASGGADEESPEDDGEDEEDQALSTLTKRCGPGVACCRTGGWEREEIEIYILLPIGSEQHDVLLFGQK